ncbi:MAG: 6-phosphogluconolactonase [Candidatus Hydrogenedentes bacterium]|nr:6-phosphogluconolactonase [Candidatus Hydrogenedentota bacterium]
MKVTRFTSFDSLSVAAAALLMRHLQEESNKPVGIMLSGGKTPIAAYRTVQRAGIRASDSVYIVFSDERMTAADSRESNFGNASGMIASLKIPEQRVLRVHTELKLDAAAEQYDRDLAGFFKRGGRIPLGLLGLGADGHTASMFTMEDVQAPGHKGELKYARAVHRFNGYDRVTVTSHVLARIERAVFLVSGPEKQAVVARLLQSPETLPAGAAVSKTPHVELWMAV